MTDSLSRLDDFTVAYIEAALWSSTDDDGESLDRFDVLDFADTTLCRIIEDCAKFQRVLGLRFRAEGACLTALPAEVQAGHDFWLTRNRHGVGFWETNHWDEYIGSVLTEGCRRLGGYELCVGDDGRLHGYDS